MSRLSILLCFVLTGGCTQGALGEGQKCVDDSDCMSALSCENQRCHVGKALQQQMAQQSGVVAQVEPPLQARVLAGAVRVRTARGDGFAFAVCAGDERLVGGWCSPSTDKGEHVSPVTQSVAGHTDEDTVGARWTCEHAALTVSAFALCQKLPATTP